MAKKTIHNLVDWSKSFVDPDGSFYCGTTEQQKERAAEVIAEGDLWVYLTDVHTRKSSEFLKNGGMYPAHNLLKKDQYNLEELGVQAGKTVSPELTEKLQNVVKDKYSGLIVPRHVFFQDYDGWNKTGNTKPAFIFTDAEETFGVKKLDAAEFLDWKVKYVVNAKHMFNAAAIQSTEWINYTQVKSNHDDGIHKTGENVYHKETRIVPIDGVPDIEMNIFTLLKQRYGQGEDLIINHTGVVMGICMYQTASGVKQIFPRAEVNVIADAATHLVVPELGFSTAEDSTKAVKSMCQQVGINYITSAEYLGKK